MMKFVPKVITRTVARKVLQTKKNSPHIFFVAGIAGVMGSTVLACRATLKLEETLDEIKEDLDTIKTLGEVNVQTGFTYDKKEHNKDVGYVYGKTAVKLGRLYGPSVVLGGVSIAALTGSHVQLVRRNTALTATLALVSKAYDDYRVRVQNEIGEKRELDLYHGASDHEVEVDGKKKIVKLLDTNGLSPYARIFDEACPDWQKDPELNRMFVQCQQNWANDRLRAQGHVFLNEVYDSLGFERSRAGAVVGWVLNGDGDNYVDFGLFEASSSRFINGTERSIVLDFNVDGIVYDKI